MPRGLFVVEPPALALPVLAAYLAHLAELPMLLGLHLLGLANVAQLVLPVVALVLLAVVQPELYAQP